MRRIVCFMLVLLLLMPLCGVCGAGAEAAGIKEPVFRVQSGRFAIDGGSVTGGGNGNVFCVSDIYFGAEESWIFTAEVRILSGNAAGLAFGIPDPDAPLKRWHCVNASQSGGYSAMFRETDARNDYIRSRSLTEAEKSAESLTLRIECDGGKTITGYVNGTVTYKYETEDYQGGYLAVMCCSAKAEFSNITIKAVQSPALTRLDVQGAEFDLPFSPEETQYWADVDYSTGRVVVDAAGDGCTVTVNGGLPCNSVPLNVGLNVIEVKAASEGMERSYYLNIIRSQDPEKLYREARRMQLHFSPKLFSVNDPNGLIYDSATGLYHLFFQCDYPSRGYKVQGDTKAWGHAVSRNLIDWEEVGLAITPDQNGVCWSGSGVIDRDNTSGLFDDSVPPESRMVFLYTYYGGKNGLGLCSIGLAWSSDHGQTFQKLPEAVIPNTDNMYSAGFRDPKVIWYEDPSMENGGVWVLIACGDQAMIFTSHDLKNWEYNSTVKDKTGSNALVTECPDLFPMELDGERYWVLFAAGAWYVLGDLEKNAQGKLEFVTKTDRLVPTDGVKELWPGSAETYGLFTENYASQTFYNTADGRRIQMSWMRDFGGYADKPWWNAVSLATELRLERIGGEPRITYHPIAELEQKRTQLLLDIADRDVQPGENLLEDIRGPLLDISASVEPGDASRFGLRLCAGGGKYIQLCYDASAQTVCTDKSRIDPSCNFVYRTVLQKDNDGAVSLRVILDANAIDVWYNDEVYHAGFAYNTAGGSGCEFFADGKVHVRSLQVYRLSGMDRSSVTDSQSRLDGLYASMTELLQRFDAAAAADALALYDALSDGERFCMPEGAAQAAASLREKMSEKSGLSAGAVAGIASGAAAAAAAAAATVTAVKKRRKAKADGDGTDA